jgi:tagatose 6-phosphate kinase
VGWGEANRVTAVERRAGGKGVNVARVLHALGHDTLVCGLCGGATGAAVLESLDLPHELVEIAGETRRTTTVVAEEVTGFWEPGPVVTAAEWDRFTATFREQVSAASAVVLSGSLPEGVPPDAYATLCAMGRVPVILDSSGEALRLGLRGRPAIVKPNAEELAEAAGDGDIFVAAERMREAGAGAVVASLGDQGLIAVTGEGRWRVRSPEPVAGNPTGAGDAVVAALAAGLDRPWPERLADAVALSAAAVHAPVAGAFDAGAYRRYRELVEVD